MYIEIKWFSSLVFDHKKRVKIEQKNDYTTTISSYRRREVKKKKTFILFLQENLNGP